MKKAHGSAMTKLEQAARRGRRIANDARHASEALVAGGELLQASQEVIAARMEILAAGLADPTKADLAEMALMSSEKVEALSASASAFGARMGGVGQRLARDTTREASLAGQAVSALAGAASPQAFATIQMNYAFGWWDRAARSLTALNGEMIRAQAEAMKPLHDAATANAKRLKR